MPEPFYITTPIYYVNDKPHIGHCYTTLIADITARFQRLIRGEPNPTPGGLPLRGGSPSDNAPHARPSVFLLTGTDEHADKVVTSAAEHGKTPQEWADQNAAAFKAAFAFMNIANDDFIRTTEPRHKDKVVQYIQELQKSGDIYKGEYTGWYDEGQEEYVTETTARENDFKSAINKKPLVKRTEPCYFFKLSQYQAKLRELIESNTLRIAPDARKNEVLGRLKPPAVLNDVPISRPVTSDPATQWGIKVPGDPANRIYVWIDALFNYLSTVDTPERKHFWPPAAHFLGKDILWFHAVIWPAMLLALKRPLPRCIYGHGWWVSEGQKMSKSLGNFIDLDKLRAYAGRYSLDALRWYLATQGPLGGNDADFSHAKFVEVYNADLANGIGNCASRVSNMIGKYFDGKVPSSERSGDFVASTDGHTLLDVALSARAMAGTPVMPGHETMAFEFQRPVSRAYSGVCESIKEFDLATALIYGAMLVRKIDKFIGHAAPFTLAKQVDKIPRGKEALAAILYTSAEVVRIASILLSPAMPEKMADLWKRWNCTPPPGVPLADLCQWGGPYSLQPGTPIEKGDALFMRADPAEPPPGA
ncbi:MAG: class I tRNA ligase family protein [Phycisphaeraceae bacterium]|nr:class I tRNA ligase family protein [Phycisphaeraceae bacterium]